MYQLKQLEEFEDMNHEQCTSSMATTRTEITHGLTYSGTRAIKVIVLCDPSMPFVIVA